MPFQDAFLGYIWYFQTKYIAEVIIECHSSVTVLDNSFVNIISGTRQRFCCLVSYSCIHEQIVPYKEIRKKLKAKYCDGIYT